MKTKFLESFPGKYDASGSHVRSDKSFMKEEFPVRVMYFRSDTFATLKSLKQFWNEGHIISTKTEPQIREIVLGCRYFSLFF